jgi:hypothetical protein
MNRVTVTETRSPFNRLRGLRISYPGLGVADSLVWVPRSIEPALLEDLFTDALNQQDEEREVENGRGN